MDDTFVFSDLLSLHSPGRCLRSSDQKKGERAFSIAGPKRWNGPVSIRTITTESLLKQGLKPTRGLLMYEPTGAYYLFVLFFNLYVFWFFWNYIVQHNVLSTSVCFMCFISKINEMK